MGRGELHTGYWWGDLRERDHVEDLGVDGRSILRWALKKCNGEAWTRLIWLRNGYRALVSVVMNHRAA
jgi:hypothetical protein